MAIRNEIRDLILRAGWQVLQETLGDLSVADEEEELHNNFEARIHEYTGRYPILALLSQLEAVTDTGHAATTAANGAVKRQRRILNLGWDDEAGTFQMPIPGQWREAIEDSAREVTEEYFRKATEYFETDRLELATECLCRAIICSTAATAALYGWPHQDRDDDLRVVVGLATGRLPEEGESIYKLLLSASQQGQDLNSAFAAAMGQPEAVRSGAYDDAGRTSEEVIQFARTAVKLADQLGRRLR